MTEVQVGQYLAVPYAPLTLKEQHNATILSGCADLPNIFPLPYNEYDRKVIAAAWLTDPKNVFWAVWQGGDIVGILGLTRIIVGLDATAHLAFFDRQLYGRRALVLKMIGWAFESLQLQRLSLEIPEHLEPLIRFCRVKLGFRYEGETLAAQHPVVNELATHRINGPARWTAKWGARRERAHFDGKTWRDVVSLRLLRDEFGGTSWAAPSLQSQWEQEHSSPVSATVKDPTPKQVSQEI